MTIEVQAYPYSGFQTPEELYSVLLDGALGGSGLRKAASCTVSGLNVTLSSVDGFIRGHRFTSGEGALGAITSATQQRIVSVIARLDYSGVPEIVTYAIVYGTTSAPAPLTQTEEGIYELRLFDITVPANASTIPASNVTPAYILHRSPSSTVVLVQEAEPENPALNTIWMW